MPGKPQEYDKDLPDQGPDEHQPISNGRKLRVGVAGTLIALHALLPSGANGTTLAITRADAIREKMAKLSPGLSQNQGETLVHRTQWFNWGNGWGNWGNWGNWPGWLPKQARRWQWPRG